MSENPVWYDGQGVDQKMDDPQNPGGGNFGDGRFYLKKDAAATIIFLTEGSGEFGPPGIFEHNPAMGPNGPERWTHYYTCLAPLGMKCPLCQWAAEHEGKCKRYKGLFFTILDLTKFTRKDGTEERRGRCLLCAKKDTAEIIARRYLARIEAGETLRGAQYRVNRGSDSKSAKVGNDYEFIRMVDLEEYSVRDQLDYREMLAPNEERMKEAIEQMKREASGQSYGEPPPSGGSGEVEGSSAEIPF